MVDCFFLSNQIPALTWNWTFPCTSSETFSCDLTNPSFSLKSKPLRIHLMWCFITFPTTACLGTLHTKISWNSSNPSLHLNLKFTATEGKFLYCLWTILLCLNKDYQVPVSIWIWNVNSLHVMLHFSFPATTCLGTLHMKISWIYQIPVSIWIWRDNLFCGIRSCETSFFSFFNLNEHTAQISRDPHKPRIYMT